MSWREAPSRPAAGKRQRARGRTVPEDATCPCLCPQCEQQPPPLLWETLQAQQVGLAQAPVQLLLLCWALVRVRGCVAL